MEDHERRLSAPHFVDWVSGGEHKLARIIGDWFRNLKCPAHTEVPLRTDPENERTKRYVEALRQEQIAKSAAQIPALVRLVDYTNERRN